MADRNPNSQHLADEAHNAILAWLAGEGEPAVLAEETGSDDALSGVAAQIGQAADALEQMTRLVEAFEKFGDKIAGLAEWFGGGETTAEVAEETAVMPQEAGLPEAAVVEEVAEEAALPEAAVVEEVATELYEPPLVPTEESAEVAAELPEALAMEEVGELSEAVLPAEESAEVAAELPEALAMEEGMAETETALLPPGEQHGGSALFPDMAAETEGMDDEGAGLDGEPGNEILSQILEELRAIRADLENEGGGAADSSGMPKGEVKGAHKMGGGEGGGIAAAEGAPKAAAEMDSAKGLGGQLGPLAELIAMLA